MEGGCRYLESSACLLKDVNVFLIKVKMVVFEKVFFSYHKSKKKIIFKKIFYFLKNKSFSYSTTIGVMCLHKCLHFRKF